MIDIYTEIRTRYGNVKRGRGYYLYTEKNVRLLDLYLDGGMSILGRKTGQLNLAAKHFFDRGLTGFLPTKAEYQLEKAIKAVLPDYPVIRWYASVEKACDHLYTAYGYDRQGTTPLWRPFLCDTTADAVLLASVYPSPYGFVAAKKASSALPPSDSLFPPLAWSIARAFFDLQKQLKPGDGAHGTAQVDGKKESKSLRQRQILETLVQPLWEQKACYLFPKIDQASYTALFYAALDAHILLSPSYHVPSILPELSCYTECIGFLRQYPGTTGVISVI
ncbi:MAG: hypothetical protein ACTTJ7_05320 [Treponema sp.]